MCLVRRLRSDPFRMKGEAAASVDVMMLVRKILVPMDFSAPAEAALDYAIELARKLDASVTVMHAYEVPALLATGVPGLMTAETVDALEKAATTALRELVAKKRSPGVKIEGELKYGDARSIIEAAVSEFDADLVCMGTHGHRGLRHFPIPGRRPDRTRCASRVFRCSSFRPTRRSPPQADGIFNAASKRGPSPARSTALRVRL